MPPKIMKRGIKTVLISLLSLLASGNPQGRNSFWIELTSENYDGNGVLLAPRVVENATALATTSNLDSYDYTFSNPSGSIAYSSSTFCGWEQNSISSTYSEYNPSISTTPLSFPVGTPKNQINLVDNRVVVSQTTAFRPGAVVAIDSTFSDGYSYGTGCLISPNVVLTCAHVLYGPSKPNGQKVARVGVSINLHGNTIRYEYGFFRQKFVEGKQIELPDQWLSNGFVFEVRKPKHAVDVKFYGNAETYLRPDGSYAIRTVNARSVRAVPYDVSVVGYRNGVANSLRLWSAEPSEENLPTDCTFDEYLRTLKELSFGLYPDDSTEHGRMLRLRQQYFLVSAGLQSCMTSFCLRLFSIRIILDDFPLFRQLF